jgi:hypothetical protein
VQKAVDQHTPRALSKGERFRVLERGGFRCVYCGRRPPEVVLHVDHAVSKKNGGGNDDENLVSACSDCNLGKSSKSADTAALPLSSAVAGQTHQLVGKFVLLVGADGRMKRQARVETVYGALTTIRWFSFWTSLPSTQSYVETSEILKPECDGGRWRIFASHHDWMLACSRDLTEGWRQGIWRNQDAFEDWYRASFSSDGTPKPDGFVPH